MCASVLLLMSGKKVKELGLKPLGKYVVSAVAGLEPDEMGLGPVHATRKAFCSGKSQQLSGYGPHRTERGICIGNC